MFGGGGTLKCLSWLFQRFCQGGARHCQNVSEGGYSSAWGGGYIACLNFLPHFQVILPQLKQSQPPLSVNKSSWCSCHHGKCLAITVTVYTNYSYETFYGCWAESLLLVPICTKINVFIISEFSALCVM